MLKIALFFEGINPAVLVAAAQKAEALGFESLWRPDHLALPAEIPATYPYSPDGRVPLTPDWPIVEPFSVFAFISSVTTTIKMGTAVYILPLRHPVVTARSVLAIDFLSRGRMMLGVGVGWLEEEFRTAGQDFHTRGERMDECIQILRTLWTEPKPEFQGKYYSFTPLHFEPKPIAKPGIPIVIGGESPAALRRAGRLGDGWYAVPHSLEEMRGFIGTIQQHRREAGRENLPFEVTMAATPAGPLGDQMTVDQIRRYEEAGVDRLVFALWRRSGDALENMERFAEATLSRVG